MHARTAKITVLWAATLLVAGAPASALAQDTPDEPDLENLHFAFANYAGSGIYSVNGRTVQVYHFPFTFELRDAEKHRWGLSLRLPPTVGIYDLQPEDAALASLVNRVATLGFVPRFNIIRRLSHFWTLTPFVDLGVAKNLDGGSLVWVYGVGLVAEAVYPMDGYDLMPLIRFVSAHHTGQVGVFGNDLVKLEPGLEARFPLGFRLKGKDADMRPESRPAQQGRDALHDSRTRPGPAACALRGNPRPVPRRVVPRRACGAPGSDADLMEQAAHAAVHRRLSEAHPAVRPCRLAR